MYRLFPFFNPLTSVWEVSMSDPVYASLLERLNQFESKVPPVPAFFKVLEELYSEEEARISADFPDGAHSPAQLSVLLKRDEAVLPGLLETMADKGQVFVVKDQGGGKMYELAPWMPGVIEFSIIRRIDDPAAISHFLKLYEEVEKEATALTEPLKADIEAFKALLPDPHVRTLLVEQAIPEDRTIQSYENLLDIISREDSFAAMRCCCREMADHRDEPCGKSGIPEYSCLSFGKVADYVTDRKFGKRITRDECVDIINACSRAGAVLNSNNFSEGIQFVCNCCGCCCNFLRGIKTVGNLNLVAPSNFLSVVDTDTCVGCGDCENQCPVSAISLDGDVAIVDSKICIGCGTCVDTCAVESISMKRVADKKPAIGDKKIGLGF
jgi:NAD-dependent dihydropyrimidine dehydrogenase PreA subunit